MKDLHLDSRVSLEAPGTRRAKRVRFAEQDSQLPLTFNPNACLRNDSRVPASQSEDPKTSEYAFYKKLREEASHSLRTQQLNEHEKLEKSEACSSSKDLTRMVKPNNEIRFLPPIEKGTPIILKSSLSTSVPSNSGPECGQQDLFSMKRQKLLYLAAESLSLDQDKFSSKGFDLVPMLLQRLVPENNAILETSSLPRTRSTDTKFNSNQQLHVPLEPDMHFKEVPPTQNMDLVNHFTAKNITNSSLESWCNKSRECKLSEEVDDDLGSRLTWHPKKFLLECERRQPDDFVDSGNTSLVHTDRNSGFDLHPSEEFSFHRDGYLALDHIPVQSRLLSPSYKKLSFRSMSPNKSARPRTSSRFKQLDDLCYTNQIVNDSEACTQFLDWGSNNQEKEQDFFNSSCDKILDIRPSWRTPSEDDLQGLNCILDANLMHSPSSHGINHHSDVVLENMIPGRRSPEVRDSQVEEPDDYRLSLRCTPKYGGLGERCRFSRILQETSDFCSPLSKSSFTSKFFGERLAPRLGTGLQCSHDFEYGHFSLPAADCFKETQLSTSSGLQLRKETSSRSSFLLARDATEMYMDHLSYSEDQMQLAEDSCCAYDLTSKSLKLPLNKDFHPLFLDESVRSGSGEISYDHNGNKSERLHLMDSFPSEYGPGEISYGHNGNKSERLHLMDSFSSEYGPGEISYDRNGNKSERLRLMDSFPSKYGPGEISYDHNGNKSERLRLMDSFPSEYGPGEYSYARNNNKSERLCLMGSFPSEDGAGEIPLYHNRGSLDSCF